MTTAKTGGIIIPEPAEEPIKYDATVRRTQNCNVCIASFFEKAADQMGHCRKEPPKAQIVMVPPSIMGQPPSFQPMSAYPPVHREQWCIDGFRAKLTKDQH